MSIPSPMRPDRPSAGSEEVELYQRTYTTLLASSGETRLRILEPVHRATQSSLHPLAGSEELDLGAFLYATQRLPIAIADARTIVMGQTAEAFDAAGVGPLTGWTEVEAAARRRQWFVDPEPSGTLGVLLASSSDLDDLIPTLVAYQVEWGKLRRKLRSIGWPRPQGLPGADDCSRSLGGAAADWQRLQEVWGTSFAARLGQVAERNLSLRVRMLGGSQVGYARMTRRWWEPVRERLTAQQLERAPMYVVSSNTHSLVNLVSGDVREREDELVSWLRRAGPADLRDELALFDAGTSQGSWENFLYFAARDFYTANDDAARRAAEDRIGVTHISSQTALRVAVQVIPLAGLDPAKLDPRLGTIDAARLAASDAVVVNVDYPLGLAAYNILREICEDRDTLRGLYVLGKAATLNADVGDVLLSNVIFDEHSQTTYWLDNAFAIEDIVPFLRFGSGLDNQRAVTVKSTFLQNRGYLDRYYREAFTVVEMEAGPYCNAVFELTDVDRYPVGAQVNFSKLPIDFGIIHYASDTPYTQARTLGARGLSYYGMDSTYASSLAILRRVLSREGVLVQDAA